MARDLAIDLGTANTLVYMKGKGIVLNEPSVIAMNRQTGEVLATGHEAWQMIGRTPGYIVAVRPLRGGAITDFDVTERMIRLLLQRVGVSRFTRPKVVICVPSAITEVERRAVTDAARRAGIYDAVTANAGVGSGGRGGSSVSGTVSRGCATHRCRSAVCPRSRPRALRHRFARDGIGHDLRVPQTQSQRAGRGVDRAVVLWRVRGDRARGLSGV